MRLSLLSAFCAVCVPAICIPTLAWANIPPEIPADKISFQPQVKGMGCLKPEAVAMLAELVAQIGAIQITSTCGGRHARRSQHYSGRAIDFRPLATSPRNAAKVARSLDSVGGVGTYSNGLVHVDVGARELSWHGHKRSRYARLASRGR